MLRFTRLGLLVAVLMTAFVALLWAGALRWVQLGLLLAAGAVMVLDHLRQRALR